MPYPTAIPKRAPRDRVRQIAARQLPDGLDESRENPPRSPPVPPRVAHPLVLIRERAILERNDGE